MLFVIFVIVIIIVNEKLWSCVVSSIVYLFQRYGQK